MVKHIYCHQLYWYMYIYHFIIWNLIYPIVIFFFIMQCPFEDDFPLSLHKKIMNDPVKFPEEYVWNSFYNIVLNQ